jgi:hypothetical protein
MSKTDFLEDWLRLSSAATFLWADAAAVIWLRGSLFLARDPGSRDEAVRMIAEKFEGNANLAIKFATSAPRSPGQAAMLSINHYGSLVRANRKRLVDQRFARKLAGR